MIYMKNIKNSQIWNSPSNLHVQYEILLQNMKKIGLARGPPGRGPRTTGLNDVTAGLEQDVFAFFALVRVKSLA